MQSNEYLAENQSAYRPYHSTTTALHAIVDDWYKSMDDGKLTAVCALDMSKGFDILNHEFFLDKLRTRYNISGKPLQWFTSYITRRRHFVRNNFKSSDCMESVLGIPQGTILGPLAFLIFVNDFLLYMKKSAPECNIHMYADDITMYCEGTTIEEISTKINRSLEIAYRWFCQNKLLINPEKSQSMLVGTTFRTNSLNLEVRLNNKIVENCSNIKLLGVEIDNNLKWKTHVESLAKQVNSRLSLFHRLSKCMPTRLMQTLYFTLIQSRLDYCLSLWGNCAQKHLGLLQRVQNRAARILTNNFDIDISGKQIVHDIGWMNMEKRCQYFILLLTYKCVNDLAPPYMQNFLTAAATEHSYSTRLACNRGLVIPKTKTELYKNSFQYLAAQLWNKLPANVRNVTSLKAFKQHAKSYIMSHSF